MLESGANRGQEKVINLIIHEFFTKYKEDGHIPSDSSILIQSQKDFSEIFFSQNIKKDFDHLMEKIHIKWINTNKQCIFIDKDCILTALNYINSYETKNKKIPKDLNIETVFSFLKLFQNDKSVI